MIQRKTFLLVGLAACFTTMSAFAQEHGSKDEAKAMVEKAIEHVKKVGPDQAWKDFSTSKDWKSKDLYVIAFDMKANMLAHGANEKLIGKNHMEMKDAAGKPMTAEMVKLVATAGSGWVDYEWPNPVSKKIESKSTYAKKLPTFDGFVGVGVYR